MLSACDFSSGTKLSTGKDSSNQKSEITEPKRGDVEKDKPNKIAGLLKKIHTDLDFDSIPDPVFLIQNNAQFSVVANIKGKDIPIFSLDYGTVQNYKNTTETYGKFSLNIILAGSVYQDENGDDIIKAVPVCELCYNEQGFSD